MGSDVTEANMRVVADAVDIVRRYMEGDLTTDRRREMGALHAAFLDFQQGVGDVTPLYNHAFTLAFSVVSTDQSGENVDAETIRQGIRHRLGDLRDDNELHEAVGAPYDSYRIGK